MRFKQYADYVCKTIKPDSENPQDIVQTLAVLIAERLSMGGKLPVSCGKGKDLDMDIVQAGLLAGLERLHAFDGTLGTLRQFLYPTMAGAMQSYAWERENRVGPSRPDEWPQITSFTERQDSIDVQSRFGERGRLTEEVDSRAAIGSIIEPALLDHNTPETLLEDEQSAVSSLETIRAAIGYLGTDSAAMLLKDSKIGYNAAKRRKWAEELGISIPALTMRLHRLRKAAREWALSLQ